MGLLDFAGRRNRESVVGATHNESLDEKNTPTGLSASHDDDLRRGSLFERNEKEVQEHPDTVTESAQLGQQKAEAAALVWSKPALYSTYAWIWVCFFLLALHLGASGILNQAAYVDFVSAPELPIAYILGTIIGGVLKLPTAKLLNIWGRAEGFAIFIGVYLLGLIILAASNGPSAWAAGYVIYFIGFYGIFLILDVFVADTSGLRNRAWAFAFLGTPYICTAFTAPLVGSSFITTSGWRWGFGAFVIIDFVVFTPLVVIFKFYQLKAEKLGLFVRKPSGRTAMQSIVHYIHEFDVVGAVLLMAAFILFLLPFSLATYGKAQYKSGTFIAMVVVGICLFPVFAIWEKFFARVQFVRWELFKQRTVLGACCLAAILFFSFYAWDTYLYTYLLVVYGTDFRDAGYILNIYNVGSTFWGVVFGIYIRYTKHFKWACLVFGLPLQILGAGLMIYFRGSEHGIGYIVMCQLFIAVGGGTLVIGEDMAVMASADRDGVPMMLALIGLFTSIGGAIGYAVAAAIYNNTFLPILQNDLPADLKANATALFIGGYAPQLSLPVGSPGRDVVNYAWLESQKYLTICATCILILGFPAIAVWKNYNVDRKQNKGTVI